MSDVTYIKLQDRYVYLSLVTDLYSKKIMGYKLDDNMKVSMVKEALMMAPKTVNTAGRPLYIIVTGAYNIAVPAMQISRHKTVCA